MPIVSHFSPAPALEHRGRAPVFSRLRRTARRALGASLGARYLPALGSRAHYNDPMLASGAARDVEAYRRGAAEVVATLDRALVSAGRRWPDVWSCLDVGCGYGRVVRELRPKLRPRAISVCDADEAATRFTASEFAVRALPIVEMLAPTSHHMFDLIYMVDVYTCLDRPMIEMNLAKVAALTRSGGIVVFTTRATPPADDPGAAACMKDFERDGFVHLGGRNGEAVGGRTFMAAEEVRALVLSTTSELDFVAHEPHALAGQDVFVYRKI